MPKIGRLLRLAVLAAAMSVFATSAFAQAAGDSEPNDDIISAVGPLSPTAISGTLDSQRDDDWYWLQLAGGQQVTLSVTFSGGGCYFPDSSASLRDYFGKTIASFRANGDDIGEAQQYHYTTPADAASYYLEIEGEPGDSSCQYEAEVTPPTAFAPASAKPPIVPVSEPDDFQNEAHAMSGDILYAGAIETVNDVDQLYFETKPDQLVAVELAGGACSGNIDASIVPPKGSKEYSQSVYASAEGRGRVVVNTYGGGRFYVTVEGDQGCAWQLLATPGSALGSEAPPTAHADPCRVAKKALGRKRQRLHRLERTLRFVSPARRGSMRHQISAQKRAVRAAKHAVQAKCGKAVK